MERFSAAFPGRPSSVAAARGWLEDLLSPARRRFMIPDDVRATAVLLLSELATNALQHTRSADGGTYTVNVCVCSGLVRVEVEDAGPRNGQRAKLREAGPQDETGRGLALVAAFADTWGPLPRGRGMYCRLSWCTEDLSTAAAPPQPGALRQR
ncbi:MAG: ATP-binding protein [Nocardiopsaceae bacterium]|nr:ATP-binding protein [Nocardiopsaceae bacterium]